MIQLFKRKKLKDSDKVIINILSNKLKNKQKKEMAELVEQLVKKGYSIANIAEILRNKYMNNYIGVFKNNNKNRIDIVI